MTEQTFVCLVRANKQLFLLTDNKGEVIGGEKQRLLGFWTDAWERGLHMGSGFSTGAMLSFIQYEPSVFQISNLAELAKIVGTEPPYNLSRVRGEGGSFYGIKCESELAQQRWEGGTRPDFFRKET